mgnify:CR=1 FL=1
MKLSKYIPRQCSIGVLIALSIVMPACDKDKKPSKTSSDMGVDMMVGEDTNLTLGDLNVLSAEARACNIILQSDRLSLASKVQFSDGVKGVTRERLPHTSISLVSKVNSAMTGEVAEINLTDEEWGEVSILSANCYDFNGQEIVGDELVSLNAN